MPLPSSGPLTLANIQTEFGGANPISLSEYYAGGAYVPAGTTGTYGAVPSSGAISIRNFYGTSAVIISLTNLSAFDFSGGARNATTGYRLTSGGAAQILENLTFTTLETWCTPTGEAVNYEALVDNVSGSGLTTGPVGTWVALSTTRTWTLVATPGNSELTTFDVSVRRAGTTTVLDTATITLESDAQF
jgi:hypothetical protein